MERPSNNRNIKTELEALYAHFPEVRKLLRTFGCPRMTAEDIFQESLIIFLRKKEDENFIFQLEPIHFIKQTCKYMWLNTARKKQKQQFTSIDNELKSVSSDWIEKELRLKQLEDVLSNMGKSCLQLLQMFYGLGHSMVEISKQLGFKNAQTAKAQKYRCITKAKELVGAAEMNVKSVKL